MEHTPAPRKGVNIEILKENFRGGPSYSYEDLRADMSDLLDVDLQAPIEN